MPTSVSCDDGPLFLVSLNTYQTPYPVYPLGLSYLASYLSEHMPALPVAIVDLNLVSEDALLGRIQQERPRAIGLSIRNVDNVNFLNQDNFLNRYQLIIERIRKVTNAPVIFGGAGFSIYPVELFEFLAPDYGVQGEGEVTLYRLINALSNSERVADIEGLVYRSNGEVVVNTNRSLPPKLNLQFNEQMADFYWRNSGMLGIQTKRGCPYECIYCTYPLIDGKGVRTVDAEDVADTLLRLKDERGIDYVFLTDSVFNIKNSYNRKLAKALIKRGSPVNWGAFFSPLNLDEELLALFKESGLTHAEFGTESLCDRQLWHYGKRFSVSQAIAVTNMCEQLGIYCAHFLILCGYGETSDTLEETFVNARQFSTTVFFPFIGMRIYPGTALQRKAIEKGVIHPNDELMSPRYYTANVPDMDWLKERAAQTGKRWVFPDEEDMTGPLSKLRKYGKKGPLWEYLVG